MIKAKNGRAKIAGPRDAVVFELAAIMASLLPKEGWTAPRLRQVVDLAVEMYKSPHEATPASKSIMNSIMEGLRNG